MKIYLVMGTTGEYSDRQEWPVVAYSNEIDAKNHVDKASASAREVFSKRYDCYSVPDGINPYDLNMSMDYTGTTYFTYKAELK